MAACDDPNAVDPAVREGTCESALSLEESGHATRTDETGTPPGSKRDSRRCKSPRRTMDGACERREKKSSLHTACRTRSAGRAEIARTRLGASCRRRREHQPRARVSLK